MLLNHIFLILLHWNTTTGRINHCRTAACSSSPTGPSGFCFCLSRGSRSRRPPSLSHRCSPPLLSTPAGPSSLLPSPLPRLSQVPPPTPSKKPPYWQASQFKSWSCCSPTPSPHWDCTNQTQNRSWCSPWSWDPGTNPSGSCSWVCPRIWVLCSSWGR